MIKQDGCVETYSGVRREYRSYGMWFVFVVLALVIIPQKCKDCNSDTSQSFVADQDSEKSVWLIVHRMSDFNADCVDSDKSGLGSILIREEYRKGA